MPSAAFVRFWRTDLARDNFLSYSAKDELQSLRLVSHDFAEQVAPVLFKEIKIIFGVNSFARQARMKALERIGHHTKKLTFHMPHNANTFLPPLLDLDTGLEQHFIYEPQVNFPSRPSSSSSSSSNSKYGSFEMTDLLIKQYPLLFHAATNIASFSRFVCAIPNVRHLHISCPDQPSGQRYRRSSVDYALISLRIAFEAANLQNLTHLTLSPIPPSATWYLRPTPFSIGASPASTRVWRRITHLDISMSSFPTSYGDSTDHLEILHSYLPNFPSLIDFNFAWLGRKGPSPVSLDHEPLNDPHRLPPPRSSRPPIRFRKLRKLKLSNVLLDATQAATFFTSHRKVLNDVDFDECDLRSGTWKDALAPLTTRGKRANDKEHGGTDKKKRLVPEVMEVPIVLSTIIRPTECERIRDMMWIFNDEGSRRSRAFNTLKRAGLKTRYALGMDSVKSFFKYSVVKWH